MRKSRNPLSPNGLKAISLTSGYKLDWLAFTISNNYNFKELLYLLRYDINEFETVSGRYFYNTGLTLGNYVNVYYNDYQNIIDDDNGTVNIIFTGQGCTDLALKHNDDIYGIFKILLDYDVHITRIDIAFDDFEKMLDLDVITEHLENGYYRSSKRSYNIVKTSNASGDILSRTIYVGKARYSGSKGNHYLRMYDKKAQYVEKEKPLPEIVEKTGVWQRYELSFTKKKAQDFFDTLMFSDVYRYDIDKLYKSVLRYTIEFLSYNKRYKNKAMWNVAKWYDDFLIIDEKFKFVSHERDITLDRLLSWISKSVMPSLKMIEDICIDKDIDIYDIMCEHKVFKSYTKGQQRLIATNKKLSREELQSHLSYYFNGGKNGD